MDELQLEPHLARLMRSPGRSDDKYSRGVVGFITGSDEYPGAALLGVSAALKCSIGMVRYAGPRRVQDLVLAAHPEVVASESSLKKCDAWVLGSGVDPSSRMQLESIQNVLGGKDSLTAVIDAGALDAVDFSAVTHHRLLLTPHFGELARLMNRLDSSQTYSRDFVAQNPLSTAHRAALITGQTVLLKSSRTVLVNSHGDCRIIGPNSEHLATAGSGDVLAGILGAVAAANATDKKFNWLDVAELAVRLHSAAADLAAKSAPVTATELVSSLGELWVGA